MRSIKKSAVICVGVLVVFFLMMQVANSTVFLEFRTQTQKQKLINLIEQNGAEIHNIAVAISEEWAASGSCLEYNQYRTNFPETLKQQLELFLRKCPIEIDEVYVYIDGHAGLVAYPTGSCVFRSTVWQRNNIYAWVDLVYCPFAELDNPETYGFFMNSESINETWYLSILYGY